MKKSPLVKLISFYNQETTAALGMLCHKFKLTTGEPGTHAGDMEASVMLLFSDDLVQSDGFVREFNGGLTDDLHKKVPQASYETLSAHGAAGG